MILKKEFVEKLKLKIPENIKKFNLIYPEKQCCIIRFNKDRLEAVYLTYLTDEYNNQITLKFNYRDFHYISQDYKFDSIYVLRDGYNERRYDKDLRLIARYLHGISILHDLKRKDKLHILNVLIEWKNFEEIFDEPYISAYQIEKNQEKVKVPYVVFDDDDILKNANRFNILNDIADEFNLNNTKYFQKCEINNNNIIKKDSIYLGYMGSIDEFIEKQNKHEQ